MCMKDTLIIDIAFITVRKLQKYIFLTYSVIKKEKVFEV